MEREVDKNEEKERERENEEKPSKDKLISILKARGGKKVQTNKYIRKESTEEYIRRIGKII